MDFNQNIAQFKDEIVSKGLSVPNEIVADGKIHRFHNQGDKPSTKNGWYIFFMDNIPCGVFGNWKEGITYKWSGKSCNKMNQDEQNYFRKQISDAKKRRDEERIIEKRVAAKQALNIWKNAMAADPSHLYLLKKKIKPFYARQKDNTLVLPVIDIEGNFRSLQYISATGDKWFLSNGAIRGHFIPIQHQPSEKRKVLICEGFATGATLAEQSPTYCVVSACNAGNLKPVAISLRKYLPSVELIICADDDRLNPNNPGLTKGREAAIAAGALLSKPIWPCYAPKSLKDFNDLSCWLAEQEVQHV